MLISRKIFLFLIPLFIICAAVSEAASDQNPPLAVGDGIVVTKDDVGKLRVFMEKRKFTSTNEQFLKVSIRIALFAAEAQKLGLDDGNGQSRESDDDIGRKVWLSELYIRKLQKDYPVSDLVVESYYYAHPQYFGLKKGENKPISAEQRAKIKGVVLAAKRSEIAATAYSALKEKYHIRVLGEGGK